MDPIERSAVAPRKSMWARAFAKLFRARPVTYRLSPEESIQAQISSEETNKDPSKTPPIIEEEEEGDEVRRNKIEEAFIAKTFASVFSVKAAYSQLQFSESPYDAEGVQSSDQTIVSELKTLSELKQSYLKNELSSDGASPESTMALSEIHEQRSLVKLHDIAIKKMDSQLRLKDSEINSLREKLAEANSTNDALERRLNSSGQFLVSENTELSALKPTHFITSLSRALRSITSFARLMMGEMESANWDLSAAASSIQPGISFWEPNHKVFAFESFVCAEMFEGFNLPYFSIETESADPNLFFGRFNELRSVKPEDYLALKPESKFATFCREKYLKLVHPKMELSFFGNLDHRNSVISNELPNTPFFRSFVEIAKRVWLLHCLAFSYSPEVSIFRVNRGAHFSEVCMESLSDEAFCSSSSSEDEPPRVAFMVAPGFEIGNTMIQCKVYLC